MKPLFVSIVLMFAFASHAEGLPNPGTTGPWAVGHMGFDATDAARDDRTLPVQAWFPVDADDAVGADPTFYGLADLGGFLLGITSEVSLDNVPVSDAGPRPLICFSHGSGGLNVQSIVLMETLASHGFIVVAPNHVGNSTFDEPDDLPYEDPVTDRPKDISFLIDHMLARNATPADPFFGRIDPEAIGVSGHSFGGYTSLAVAAGFDASAFGPVEPDPRVRAIVPISAGSTFFSEEELASIQIPTLLIGGTLDTAVPIDPEHTRAMEFISSLALYRVDVIDATHTHFAGICDFASLLLGFGLPVESWPDVGAEALIEPYFETCAPGAFPIGEAHRIQNLYAVSFFRRHLLGEFQYQRFLTRWYARRNEPDVAFFIGGSLSGGPIPGCEAGAEVALILPLLWAIRRCTGR